MGSCLVDVLDVIRGGWCSVSLGTWFPSPASSFPFFLPFTGWFKYSLNHMLVFLGSSQLWGRAATVAGGSGPARTQQLPPRLGRAAVSVLLARLGEGLVRQVLVMSPAPSPTSPGVCNRGQKSRKETQHQLFPEVRRGGQQRVQGPRVRGRHPPLLTREFSRVQHQEPALFLHPPPSVSVSVSVSGEGRERGS